MKISYDKEQMLFCILLNSLFLISVLKEVWITGQVKCAINTQRHLLYDQLTLLTNAVEMLEI